MLVKVAPDVYAQNVSKDKRRNKELLVECMNAIYGTMVAGLLYYRLLQAWPKKVCNEPVRPLCLE
jgi:hypothetical protein